MNTQSQSDEKYVGPRILYQDRQTTNGSTHATYDNHEKLYCISAYVDPLNTFHRAHISIYVM